MPEAPTDLVVVLSTLETESQARELARRLVDERLIACGNIIPGLTSIYRWHGTVEENGEVLLLMKTRAERVDALRTRVLQLHPYDVPEVLVLPVTGVAEAYGGWVRHETTEVIG